jgi:hypothetical protein
MAHRSIEILIGRLITDETFRAAFLENAATTLTGFIGSGFELTPLEITAVQTTRADVWARVAERIDPRLRKASFRRSDRPHKCEEAGEALKTRAKGE